MPIANFTDIHNALADDFNNPSVLRDPISANALITKKQIRAKIETRMIKVVFNP